MTMVLNNNLVPWSNKKIKGEEMINLKDSEFRELTGYMKANYGINLTEKKASH